MRKRKILLDFCWSVALVLLIIYRPFVGTLNYDTFLALLEANRFSFEVDDWEGSGFLNGRLYIVHIGDEQLGIYEYDSHEAMLIDSSFVCRHGTSISNPISGYMVQITWPSNPYWFKRDLIIVQYTGTNRRIINFLHLNLELFAGHGYR